MRKRQGQQAGRAVPQGAIMAWATSIRSRFWRHREYACVTIKLVSTGTEFGALRMGHLIGKGIPYGFLGAEL